MASESTPTLSWVPSRDVFLRRMIMTSVTTFALLLAVGLTASRYLDWSYLWAFPTSLILTLGFILDDMMRWRSVRYDRWEIDEGCLAIEVQDDIARIPLTDIINVTERFGNRVAVELSSGESVVLSYQPFPAETASAIRDRTPL